MELCSAVLGLELAELIKEHLGFHPRDMHFYTDSKVVLGHLTNESKRFYVYVGNRVRRIRASSNPSDWRHVSTENNSADCATRGIESVNLQSSVWINGPEFLKIKNFENVEESYELVDTDNDKELRPDVRCYKTDASEQCRLGSERFGVCSEWKRLVSAIS